MTVVGAILFIANLAGTMILTRLLSRIIFGGRQAWGQGGDLCQLSTQETIRKILARERIRSDRTGKPFSVISFAPREQDQAEATLSHLASFLRKRLRCTDELGWLNERELCVILPHTTPQGAWAVADSICLSCTDPVPPPLCSVFSYPWNGDDASGWNDADDVVAVEAKSQRVQSLEPLFLKALPLWKRTLDILVSSLAVVLLLPVLGMIAAAIKFSSRGPVLFRQRRSGRGGQPFMLLKFRTMVLDAEAKKKELLAANEQDGPAFKIRNDPRITRLGKFLRTTSLDELPQLWNILRGEMTLVGPRPLPCDETAACESWHRRRLDVTPGLTCIWQVRGRGGVPFADWIRMDLQYIRSRSLFQDLKLLFLTVPAVLLRRGAH